MAQRSKPRQLLLLVGLLLLVVGFLGWMWGWAGRQEAVAPGRFEQALESEEHIRHLLHVGDYANAVTEARKLLKAHETAGDSLLVADALDLLVRSLWRLGKGGEPETHALAQRSLRIRQNLLGPNALPLAKSLKNLGMLLSDSQHPIEAQRLFERALSIVDRKLEPNDLLRGEVLAQFGYHLLALGEYAEAIAPLEEALEILQHAEEADPIEESTVLNGLALVDYEFKGDYVSARKRYERILEIRTKALPPAHPLLAGTYNNLGLLLRRIGDQTAAREMFENAIEIRERLDPNHPLLVSSLNNLATVLQELGEIDAAQRAYETALEIQLRAEGEQHLRVGILAHNLGWLHYEKSDFQTARLYYDRALRIFESTVGLKDLFAVTLLQDMATLSYAMGEVDSVASQYRLCIEIQEEILGSEHPRLADSYSQYATALANIGETEAALQSALHAEILSRRHLQRTARSLAEREALLYSGVRVRGLELALHLAAERAVDDEAIDEVLDALIRSRALVLDEMATRNREVAPADRAEIAQLSAELTEARNQLAQLSVQGPKRAAPQEYRKEFEAARLVKEDAERRLADRSAAFREGLRRADLGLKDVQRSLPKDAALIGYAIYSLPHQASAVAGSTIKPGGASGAGLNGEPSSRLIAFVLRSDAPPHLVSLGALETIEILVAGWRTEAALGTLMSDRTSEQADEAYRQRGAALRAAIWDPLQPAIADVKRVFIVPDGVVHQVNIAALPLDVNRYVIDTGLVVHYFASERDLVPVAEDMEIGAGLLALGGADFDEEIAFEAAQLHREDGSLADKAIVYRSPLFGSSLQPCPEFSSMRFTSLPATKHEVEAIHALWQRSSQQADDENAPEHPIDHLRPEVQQSILLTGAQANEARFKREATGKRVLHLATHGFFLGGMCSSASGRMRGLGSAPHSAEAPVAAPSGPGSRPLSSPLLLAGLVMAGANERAKAQPGQEDGILTGEEIAALNLRGVEWAVLSACDTGMGEAQAGEGVLGLRRAFQVAGVRSLIMSLWAVSDTATQEWMEILYRARLQQGMRTADAVHHASTEILERRRLEDVSTHPFYWASFVSAGDWL